MQSEKVCDQSSVHMLNVQSETRANDGVQYHDGLRITVPEPAGSGPDALVPHVGW